MPKKTLSIDTAPVFEPLLGDERYKGAYGGRASAKSHFMAEYVIERAVVQKGHRGLCFREVQKTLKQSAKHLLETKLKKFRLGEPQGFKVFNEVIQTPGDGLIMFTGLSDLSTESIKSIESVDTAWGEESQTLSQRSLDALRPTVRNDDSQLLFSWNPRFRRDPVDYLFRGPQQPTSCVSVESNWSDNPYLPAVMEQERLDFQRTDPDRYLHVWQGEYTTFIEGAYYAKHLIAMKEEQRLTFVPQDKLMSVYSFWDIGGTGAKADACAIVIAQFIGKEIRVLNYYEAQGQELSMHVDWLRANGYGNAEIVLPHDGVKHDSVFNVSFESALSDAGFDVDLVKNQGKGAAMKRVEQTRRLFPRILINKATTEPLVEALSGYAPKFDEKRGVDLGPDHNSFSHAADAFGLMCTYYEEPTTSWNMPMEPELEQSWVV